MNFAKTLIVWTAFTIVHSMISTFGFAQENESHPKQGQGMRDFVLQNVLLYRLISEPTVARDLKLSESDRKKIDGFVSAYIAGVDEIYSVGIDVFQEKHGFHFTTPRNVIDAKQDELDKIITARLYDEFVQILDAGQEKRFSQIAVQIALYSPEPLGMYEHKRVNEFVTTSSDERAKVKAAIKENRKKYYLELVELQKDYQRRIRETLSMDNAEKLAKVIGDPVFVPVSFFPRNEATFEPTFTKVFSRRFVQKTGARVSGILAHPWLSNDLDITAEQKKQIGQLDKETTKALKGVTYEGVYKELEAKLKAIDDETKLSVSDRLVYEQYGIKVDEAYDEYYRKLGEILLPHQVDRLRQMMLQIGLNNPAPFGIFVNEQFVKLMKLDARDKRKMEEAIVQYAPDYFEKADSIKEKYHRRVRKAFKLKNTRKLNDVFGKPFEYLKPGQ